MSKKFSLDEFVHEARRVHGGRYGYDLLAESSPTCRASTLSVSCQCGIERRSGRAPTTHTFDCMTHGTQVISTYLFKKYGEQCPACEDKSLSTSKGRKRWRSKNTLVSIFEEWKDL